MPSEVFSKLLLAVQVLFLKAAALHLRLTAFFDKTKSPNYHTDLRNVYIAASALSSHLSDMPWEQFAFVPRYIEQMMLAASVTLLKILTSFYASHVDVHHGRNLFFTTVTALRKLSVRSNDLPQRLAEVMAQLWQSSGASEAGLFKGDGNDVGMARDQDDSLQLKVRCRSSLSVLYDAIWRWRERAGQAGRESLVTADTNPTALPTDVNARTTPQPPSGMGGPMAPSHGLLDGTDFEAQNWDATYGGNAVFDPLSWALDGNLGLTGHSLFGGNDMGIPPFGSG